MKVALKILTGQECGSQLSLPDGNLAKKFGSTTTMRKGRPENYISELENKQAEYFRP